MNEFRQDDFVRHNQVRATFNERFGKLTEGQSDDEIAEQIGTDPCRVQLWKIEMPQFYELPQIADAYGVTVDYLLGRKKEYTPPEIVEITEKEPATAEAGQAKKDTYHDTNNIAQSEEVVNPFPNSLPLLEDIVIKHFDGAKIECGKVNYNSKETCAKVEFTTTDNRRYQISLAGYDDNKEEQP